MGVDPFQAEVARIALLAGADHGFALAGGNALVAHGLVNRPTQDVDLFSPEPGAPGAVTDGVCQALESRGYRVEVTRRPEDSGGEFAQLIVSRDEQTMLLDLARDWRQLPPVTLDIGLVLHVDDAVGSKVTAMVGRGLPRDFIDFTAAAAALDSIPAEAFAPYGLDESAVNALRTRFADWSRDERSDIAGHRTYDATHAPSAHTSPDLGRLHADSRPIQDPGIHGSDR